MVMLSQHARAAIDGTTSSSFACDLKNGCRSWNLKGAAYHATMPTDALVPTANHAGDASLWLAAGCVGAQVELGRQVRELLERCHLPAWQRGLLRHQRGGELHQRPGRAQRQKF